MAYTAPSAVVTGQSITASLYNTYVKDNILDHESRIVTAGPAGLVSPFAGASAPSGWLLCDGSAVSQTTYAALYAVVGANAFGTDGGGNFYLPNLKGRTVIGVGVGTEITGVRGTLQGLKEVTLTGAESGTSAHSHTNSVSETSTGAQSSRGIVNNLSTAGGGSAATMFWSSQTAGLGGDNNAFSTAGNHTHSVGVTINNSTAAAASSAHTNIQPSMPLNYIIKF